VVSIIQYLPTSALGRNSWITQVVQDHLKAHLMKLYVRQFWKTILGYLLQWYQTQNCSDGQMRTYEVTCTPHYDYSRAALWCWLNNGSSWTLLKQPLRLNSCKRYHELYLQPSLHPFKRNLLTCWLAEHF